ncbi:unnamed protein product [Amaranthus hypochondriacus]
MRSQNQSGGNCKIRKRVSSSSSSSSSPSSSSSSSVVKNYRFKKAILVRKSRSATSVPTWKFIMAASPLQTVFHNNNNNNNNNNEYDDDKYDEGKEAMSARKLGATLWEINGFKLHSHKSFDAIAHSPAIDGSTKVGLGLGLAGIGHRRRSSSISQKLQISKYISEGKPNSIEVGTGTGTGSEVPCVKTRLKDVNNSLIASKELVKVLFRFLSQEEKNSSRITLFSALRVELDRAKVHMDKLIQDAINERDQEKSAWKRRERQRIEETVSGLAKELDIEKKLRRQADRLNKKLGKELADTRALFSQAMKELDCERRSREILEQTCDELARGIGEERVEAEELKRETAKAREEVEKERQMLQLADVLREERVQMKLAEARYEYEEKNAALERLKSEIHTYLKTKQDGGDGDSYLLDFKGKIQGQVDDEGDPKGGSGDSSELHSIELSMENNRSYKWSFACEENADSRRASMDEVFKGRRSLSEKIQWETICLQRKTSEWDFSAPANDKLLPTTSSLEIWVDPLGEDDQQTNVKSESASPAFSIGNSSRLREACSAILQDLASRREHLQGKSRG